MKKETKFLLSTMVLVSLWACNNGPKVIEAEKKEVSEKGSSGIFSSENSFVQTQSNTSGSFTEDLHKVIVNEVLPASRYIYLNVTENGQNFWIATRKQEVEKGKAYFYKGGLLKTNFESKEYNRVFETIYLVSNIVPENHGGNTNLMETTTNASAMEMPETTTAAVKVTPQKGSISIAEIVNNPTQYEGKTVQVTGKCTKINPNIMNRNWIHLKDGSKDNYDFVVTSETFVPEGNVVTVQAVVSLNKDFGAGYKYALILENGKVLE
ncbi:MAG: GW dipeptide domain-containing protein [Flavobacteriaceae bacterium]